MVAEQRVRRQLPADQEHERLIDANKDGKAELIASAPGEDTDDGAAWVFPGTSDGTVGSGSWSFNGGSLSAPVPDARFGDTLTP
ncbi:integrin alpha [Streptomyces sp. NPDC056660]|uniref:integrin alpha n=1 Tax=Streptomyces sp. NPDC056660 TaxID=3345897 RepID=UPI0036AECCC9